MIVIGLTGGMAMGKSTAARFYRSHHVPVFDADAVVHQLQSPKGRAIPALRAAFPGAFTKVGLDRALLRQIVMADPVRLAQLESIMHPLVRAAQRKFRAQAQRARARLCVLDIPLLFETGGDRRVDLVVTASAPHSVQLHRIREQRHLPEDQIKSILAHQLPDKLRRKYADLVVPTGLSRYHSLKILKTHLLQLLAKDPSCVRYYLTPKRRASIHWRATA